MKTMSTTQMKKTTTATMATEDKEGAEVANLAYFGIKLGRLGAF